MATPTGTPLNAVWAIPAPQDACDTCFKRILYLDQKLDNRFDNAGLLPVDPNECSHVTHIQVSLIVDELVKNAAGTAAQCGQCRHKGRWSSTSVLTAKMFIKQYRQFLLLLSESSWRYGSPIAANVAGF